ncbi:MAG: hypothetical protein JW995_05560 [Melioribacteraceae bacterium]|nr:hypothetical protein [Melioribacteraceae bacterium]
MDSNSYEIYCHFSALGKMVIKAASLDEAIHHAESDEKIKPDEIIRLTKPCIVDLKLSHEVLDSVEEEQHQIEFKNWGSE